MQQEKELKNSLSQGTQLKKKDEPNEKKRGKSLQETDRLTLGGGLVERVGGVEPVRRQARPEGAVHFPA